MNSGSCAMTDMSEGKQAGFPRIVPTKKLMLLERNAGVAYTKLTSSTPGCVMSHGLGAFWQRWPCWENEPSGVCRMIIHLAKNSNAQLLIFQLWLPCFYNYSLKFIFCKGNYDYDCSWSRRGDAMGLKMTLVLITVSSSR